MSIISTSESSRLQLLDVSTISGDLCEYMFQTSTYLELLETLKMNVLYLMP